MGRPWSAMAKVWTTKDGRNIPIQDMTDQHLVNTLLYLRRTSVLHLAGLLALMMTTPGPQGEAAQDCFDREFDVLLDSCWMDFAGQKFEHLVNEAEERGILPDDYLDPAYGEGTDLIAMQKAGVI